MIIKMFFFFFKYREKIYPFKLEITRAYFQKLKDNDNQDFQAFLFKTTFPSVIKTYPYFIEKSKTFVSKRWPILIADNFSGILGDAEFYLSPELYANKSFLKKFNETTTVDVTTSMLNSFRTRLKDQNYSISKIHGFKSSTGFTQLGFKEDDFIHPDFKIHVKLKDPPKTTALFKETLEFSYSILEKNLKIKKLAPANIEDLQGKSGYIKKLSEKVNLKSLTYAYENFFLYALENIIKPVFTTELQKEFSIYGLISFSGETKKTKLIRFNKTDQKIKI